MKKILVFLVLIFVSLGNCYAQQYFQMIRNTANKVVNNPNSSQEMVDINQFEITVLNYIGAQVAKRGVDMPPLFYDIQAVSLKLFVDDFLYNLLEAKKISSAKRKEVMDCFQKASSLNPLFKDTDKRTTNVYMTTNSLTPFSLDTDWEKAYDYVSQRIKTIIK